jgi:hypothetical protein
LIHTAWECLLGKISRLRRFKTTKPTKPTGPEAPRRTLFKTVLGEAKFDCNPALVIKQKKEAFLITFPPLEAS